MLKKQSQAQINTTREEAGEVNTLPYRNNFLCLDQDIRYKRACHSYREIKRIHCEAELL